MGKEDFKFSSSHFVAFDGFRERLHGHNYTCAVRLKGEVRQSEQQPPVCLPAFLDCTNILALCTRLSSSSSSFSFGLRNLRCPLPGVFLFFAVFGAPRATHPILAPEQPVSFNSFVIVAGLSILFEDKMSPCVPPPPPVRADDNVTASRPCHYDRITSCSPDVIWAFGVRWQGVAVFPYFVL